MPVIFSYILFLEILITPAFIKLIKRNKFCNKLLGNLSFFHRINLGASIHYLKGRSHKFNCKFVTIAFQLIVFHVSCVASVALWRPLHIAALSAVQRSNYNVLITLATCRRGSICNQFRETCVSIKLEFPVKLNLKSLGEV